MKLLAYILIVVACALALHYSLEAGLNRSELGECKQWQERYQSMGMKERGQFVGIWEAWQSEQCKAQGVDVFDNK